MGRVQLSLLALVYLTLATSAGGAEVTVRLNARTGSPPGDAPPITGVLILRPVGGDATSEGERRVEVGGPVVQVDLSSSGWWQVTLDAPGWWSPPAVLAAGTRELRVDVHPTGELELVARTPRAGAPPAELAVHFQPPPRGVLERPGAEEIGEGTLRGEIACQRAEADGGAALPWTCELPAGRHELRFRAPGFASVFRWDVPVGAGARRRLPALELVPGAALFGWIEWPESEIDPGDVHVRLLPMTLAPAGPQALRMAATAQLSERGLFQFRGLAAGTYRLLVEAPGHAVEERRSLDVLEGRETELLSPLRLLPPASLEVCVDPPAPPGPRRPGDTWIVTLYPERSRFRPPQKGSVGETGCWTAAGLPPGEYRVVVEDGRDSRWRELWTRVEPGAAHRTVELPLIPVEGEIRRGGEPARARLIFRQVTEPDDGAEPYEREVVLYADPEGVFVGALPAGGVWRVGAAFSRSGGEQGIATVDVRRPRRGAVELRFEVPDVTLRGRIVDATGAPVAFATVRMTPRSGDLGVSRGRSDDRGRFEFGGVTPGVYRVQTVTLAGSAEAEVDVREIPPPPEVELVLAEQVEVSGLVHGRDGPVFGAQVQALPELVPPRQVPLRRATTDARGRFTLRVPAAAAVLRLLVLAPGHGASAFRVDPGTGRSLLLPVDHLAGTLVLEADPALPPAAELRIDGVPVFLSQLRDWLHVHGGEQSASRWVVPAMGLGEYALCPAPVADGTACDHAFLPPGGTATLRLTGAPQSPPPAAGGEAVMGPVK